MRRVMTLAILAALAWPVALSAEALPTRTFYPAPEREAAMLRSLTVEPFSGRDGRTLSLAVERALAGASDRRGGPYFVMRAYARGLSAAADGVVTGNASAFVEETGFKGTVRRCPDGGTQCKDGTKINVEVPCRKRIVRADPDVRIIRVDDRAVVFSRRFTRTAEASWCQGEQAPESVEAVVLRMIDGIAGEVREAVVPRNALEQIRVREDRKGMTKPDGEQFKAALRLTKSDPAVACRAFEGLAQAVPGHPTLAFNIALCAESAGDRVRAVQLYRAVPGGSRGAGRDVDDGLRRIAATEAALADEAARARGN